MILDSGLSDAAADAVSRKPLFEILHCHPDMAPSPMDDGNSLVRYNHPAVNVVLNDVASAH